MTVYASNKLRLMSFVATWAVVCIHSRTDFWNSAAIDWVHNTQRELASLFDFAVPMFFVISGFMFVRSYMRYGWLGLLKRKFKSLYVPYVIWSLLAIVLCLPIRIYQQVGIPSLTSVLGVPFLLVDTVNSGQFWYLRILMIFIAASPLIIFIAKNKWMAIIIMCIVMMIPAESRLSSHHIPVSVFYFLGGCILSSSRKCRELLENDKFVISAALIGLICVLCLNVYKDILPFRLFHRLIAPIGVMIVLWAITGRGFTILGSFMNSMFFVFCVHMIVITWVSFVVRYFCGTGNLVRILAYFCLMQTFWADIAIAVIVRRIFPGVYEMLSGGR